MPGEEPTMLVRTAAKQLGIAHELLSGLIQSRAVRGSEVVGRSGQLVWVIPVSEYRRLREEMALQG